MLMICNAINFGVHTVEKCYFQKNLKFLLCNRFRHAHRKSAIPTFSKKLFYTIDLGIWFLPSKTWKIWSKLSYQVCHGRWFNRVTVSKGSETSMCSRRRAESRTKTTTNMANAMNKCEEKKVVWILTSRVRLCYLYDVQSCKNWRIISCADYTRSYSRW